MIEPEELSAFPIVGIGAAAGGLDAIRRLLGALPSDTGMAYVLLQHLDPRHESMLAGLLSEATQMNFSEVQEDMRVEANHVYVVPPSKGLTLDQGMLKLVPRSLAGSLPMPIDSFLKTLAEVQGSQAIGVILSGMGSDGTLGLQAIVAQGGIVFAQEPASARNTDMPSSAIRSGHVDFILSPEGIAGELARLGRHPYLLPQLWIDTRADTAAQARKVAPADPDGEDREGLATILERLRQAVGTDFSGYKKTTLRRRIARRMAVRHIETLREYARQLAGDETEAAALYEDCFISVTSFFREPEVFRALSAQVLPRLLEGRHPGDTLRVWVPGCATGEEVYSMAICLLEQTIDLPSSPSLQIFGTDLSEAALTKARQGTYLMNIARDVSVDRLRRFFTKAGESYQVSQAVREMCVFARHDLTRDLPYSRMDLISGRNALIYLEAPLQEMVFGSFHSALRPDGFLLVGPADTAGHCAALFDPLDARHRIYSRKTSGGPPPSASVKSETPPSGTEAEGVFRSPMGAAEQPRPADEPRAPAGEDVLSGNNELPLAKAELQSANDELRALNEDLKNRNLRLTRSIDEIQRDLDEANDIVNAVPLPLLILDSELRVEKANVAFYETFESTVEHTQQRSLVELGGRPWNHPALLLALRKLLESGRVLEDLEIEAELISLGRRTLSLQARRLDSERGGRRILLAIRDRTAVEPAE